MEMAMGVMRMVVRLFVSHRVGGKNPSGTSGSNNQGVGGLGIGGFGPKALAVSR
jgi:hypothetical protein